MTEEWALTPELHELLYQKFKREQSAKAREILAELRTKLVEAEPESYSDGDIAVFYEYLDSLNAQISGVKMMADRLGLTLTDEQEDR